MNLKGIREEINAALDYNPELQQYRDIVTRVVNRHYLQVSSQYHWLFMQQKSELVLRQEVTGSATNSLTFSNSRVGSLPTGVGTSDRMLFNPDVVGQILEIDNQNYLITHRPTARHIIVDRTPGAFTVDSWKIKYEKYALPRDCVEVLGMMDRGLSRKETVTYTDPASSPSGAVYTSSQTITGPEKGRFTFLDARKEEFLFLDRDSTGDSFVSVEETHENLDPPEFAPRVRLNAGPTGVNLVDKATYEYCYTFTYAGWESPPSPTTQVKYIAFLGGTPQRVELTGLMQPSAFGLATDETGMMKKVYRRMRLAETIEGSTAIGSGAWRHIATLREDQTTYNDRGLELTTASDYSDNVNLTTALISTDGVLTELEHLYEGGPVQYIRTWYTPGSDFPVVFRYLRRPRGLTNDSDTPMWPVQYHHLLVYLALQDICLQHGMAQQATIYERRAIPLLERMKSKYLSRTDRMYVRRGFDQTFTDLERWGVPSKT